MKVLLLLIAFATCEVVSKPAARHQDFAFEAAAIKPTAAELKWLRVPWQLDVAEGLRLSRQMRRPLLLWLTGDDPLERC